MHKQIEYKAGATCEVIKCFPRGCRKGIIRQPMRKKTKEEMQEANRRQTARKLERKLNANFRPGDWHIVLTYRREGRPDPEGAQIRLKKMIDGLRREYKKRGQALKYIVATEYKSKSIHHHLILNNVNDGKETTADMVRRLWKENGNPKFVQLYDTGEYSQLADYLIKETERTFRENSSPVRQRYSCSRNLKEPKKRVRMKRNVVWKQEPRPRPGYYIVPGSLYNGFDRFGYPYQRYVMAKTRVSPEDWEDT